MDAVLQRHQPSTWEQLRLSPILFIARRIYAYLCQCQTLLHEDSDSTIRVVCISDTHNVHNSLPETPFGDIFIHAGDLTQTGTTNELLAALTWMSSLPHPHKIFIAGNHDKGLVEPEIRDMLLVSHPDLTYLDNASTSLTIRGRTLSIYGNPRTPGFGPPSLRYPRIRVEKSSDSDVWSSIPPQTDVLVTHGPPAGHLEFERAGCAGLLYKVWKIRPKLHVFGHIHSGRGVERVYWTNAQQTYEKISLGLGGLWDLLVLVLQAASEILFNNVQYEDGTTMVNAAAVGGFRDELRRGAIVVDI